MAELIEKAENYVSEKVANMDKPEPELTDVDVTKVSHEGVTLNVKVSVKNPYSHAIPICEVTYTLKSLDSYLEAENYVSEKVANMDKPEPELTDVDVTKVSREGVTLNVKVSVKNPYSHAIPICEVTYTLKSLDRVIASGTIPDQGSIMANTVTLLEVPMKIPYSVLISLARNIGTDWAIDYELDLGLIFDLPLVGNITIPLSEKGQIKLPTLRDLF